MSFIFLKNAELSDLCNNGLHAFKKLMLLNDKNVWILNFYLTYKYKLIKVKFKKRTDKIFVFLKRIFVFSIEV